MSTDEQIADNFAKEFNKKRFTFRINIQLAAEGYIAQIEQINGLQDYDKQLTIYFAESIIWEIWMCNKFLRDMFCAHKSESADTILWCSYSVCSKQFNRLPCEAV